ncbi:MAG: O-antigen ligase family protein [Sphingomonas bacterium]|nr:O-antigen ligase family protein [Sphingomonas bacterium]
MTARLQSWLIPAYVLLCLLIGGSTQGVWGVVLLQWLAIAILAWSAVASDTARSPTAARPLMLIAGAALLLLIAQLIPLPPALWTALPGRSFLVEGYRLTGLNLPWLPMSLAWHSTLATAMTLLPPFAVLVGLLRFKATTEVSLYVTVLIGTLCGILLGLVQVASGGGWYLYRFSAFGTAAGFFANSNHMATLLLISVPFLAAVAGDAWDRAANGSVRSLILAVALGLTGVIAIGIVLNGSFAILLLGLPVVLATLRIVFRGAMPMRRSVVLAALAAIIAIGAVSVVERDRIQTVNQSSFDTRSLIWGTSISAARDHWLTGSGVGTFQQVYPRYEADSAVDGTYINHAHNDYLELAIETGIPGALLVVAFLLWWGRRAIAIWTTGARDRYALAATIASAIILLHSLVDFPLRTAAISALFALTLAVMVRQRVVRRAEVRSDFRPARHLEL